MPSPLRSTSLSGPHAHDLPTDLGEAGAHKLDAEDRLRDSRQQFCIPRSPDGKQEVVYLCGNSLGLMPKATREAVIQELDDWAKFGVEGHFHAKHPWFPAHEFCRETAARLVGARPHEVVVMNSLTVNLHLMMATFYRPTKERYKIVIEDAAFPSDSYAVWSQTHWHGLNPAEAVVRLKPRDGEQTLRTDDILAEIEKHRKSIALVMLSGVNYLTGQVFDFARVTEAGHRVGANVGWDLAHAAGNIPLHLHDWNADFACWCSYKYLNSGAGAVAGCFVNERHVKNTSLPRFAGWWGNDPEDAVQDGAGVRAGRVGGRVVALEPARAGPHAGAGLARDLRQGRDVGAAAQERAVEQLSPRADRGDELAADRDHHAA